MARLPRLVLADQAHHVIQRGNNRQAIVLADADREQFLDILRDCANDSRVAVHAYALMDNHLHLLATPEDAQGLSRLMQSLGRRYVAWFNHKYQRSGTLWEGRFRASLIDSERYFLTCMRYIELNPVRAGLCAAPQEFAWSSCSHHLGSRRDLLVTDHPLFWSLGNTPFERDAAYGELLGQGLAEDDRRKLTEAVLRGRPLGEPNFLKQLANQNRRFAAARARGRPRKPVVGQQKIDSDPI